MTYNFIQERSVVISFLWFVIKGSWYKQLHIILSLKFHSIKKSLKKYVQLLAELSSSQKFKINSISPSCFLCERIKKYRERDRYNTLPPDRFYWENRQRVRNGLQSHFLAKCDSVAETGNKQHLLKFGNCFQDFLIVLSCIKHCIYIYILLYYVY